MQFQFTFLVLGMASFHTFCKHVRIDFPEICNGFFWKNPVRMHLFLHKLDINI